MKYTVDVRGQTCPVPLVELRKAVRKAARGDIITINGTHESSRKEIPMAIDSLGLKIIENSQSDDVWTIVVEV